MFRALLLALQLSSLLRGSLGLCGTKISFQVTDGLICINSQFIQSHGLITAFSCAYLCGRNQRCQAFSLADGPCQLFVFDKCSKSVRDCSCSRRGQVFVRQQPGLEAGALCPSGYGDDLCGVKYKLHAVAAPASMTWYQGREKCESDGGLAMMADMTSDSEKQHILYLNNKYIAFGLNYMFLGGFQAPGSAEPSGGWSWLPCNITVDPRFWTFGEPGNLFNAQNTVAVFGSGIGDFNDKEYYARGMLCECLSPFN